MSEFRHELDAYIRREAAPSHKYGHQPRLYALTQQIAARIHPAPAYDDDIVFAAAYLHDLGVFTGNLPKDPAELPGWDHVACACNLTPQLLEGIGFPPEKVPAVLACIREHQPHNDPHSFEATLLRDADILEQLGAVGILRIASKLGSDTRFRLFADARDALQRALDQLPAQLRLDAARELAIPRIQTLREFLLALDSEAGSRLH
jgi:uncharacterized protein